MRFVQLEKELKRENEYLDGQAALMPAYIILHFKEK